MRHHAGAPSGIRERLAWPERDAHRSGAHGPTVGGAESAGFLQTRTFGEFLQCRFGGRPQQVKRPLGFHIGFPLQQITGVPGVVEIAAVFDKPMCEYERLLRIVGNRTGLHIRRDGLLRHGIHERGDRTAIIPSYAGLRHALRGHAQRIAQRKPGHRPIRALPHLQRLQAFGHNQHLS